MPQLKLEWTVTPFQIVQVVVLLGGFLWTYFTITGQVQVNASQLANLVPRVTDLEVAGSSFNTRLTVVESRAETQSKSAEKLTNAVDTLSNTVQGLAITAATTKTDVGYVRDYIEDLKRSGRSP